MHCNNCGKELAEGEHFCTECGTELPEEELSEVSAAEETTVPANEEELPELTVEQILAEAAAAAEAEEEPVERYVPSKKKKKKGKGVLITVIVVVLVAALGVGAWFGYNWWTDSQTYKQANALLAERNYDEALKLYIQLGDFEDSAQKAAELTKQQMDYDAALKLLEEEKFSEAQKGFAALKDYRDSVQYAKYAEAQNAFAEAEEEAEYVAAAELFEALGEFQDSKTMVSKCYLEAAHAAVEAGNAEDADKYLEKMTEEDQKLFEEAYHDAEVLEGWEKALQARYDMEKAVEEAAAEEEQAAEETETAEAAEETEQTEETAEETEATEETETVEEQEEAEEAVVFDLTAELELLKPLTELVCKDKNLEKLLAEYVEAVEMQQNNLSNAEGVDWVAFYEQELARSKILDELNEKYDFLKDNEELSEYYLGMVEYYEACVAIEGSLTQWSKDAQIQEEEGKSFVDYTNDTEYDFTLTVCFIYFDADGKLISEEYLMGSLKASEKLRFYLEIPEGADSWNLDFVFEDYRELEPETTTEQ